MFSRATAFAAAVTICVLVLTSAARPAAGYVRYRSSMGNPYGWRVSCVEFTVFPGLAGFTAQQLTDIVTASAAVWSRNAPALAACTYLDLRVKGAAAGAPIPQAGFDRTNAVAFRSSMWEFDNSALAITSVFSRTNGDIVDTDLEVNAAVFQWADLLATPGAAGRHDLQNALTHEMGHAIGLDHTCFSGGGAHPVDQNGVPIVDCDNASAAVHETTMFPSAVQGDVDKRTLAADDRRAVCEIYPLAADPMLPASCLTTPSVDAGTVPGADAALTSDAQDDARSDASGEPPPDAGGTGGAGGAGADAASVVEPPPGAEPPVTGGDSGCGCLVATTRDSSTVGTGRGQRDFASAATILALIVWTALRRPLSRRLRRSA